MKDKKLIAISNAFQKILDESSRKPSKMWIDKGIEFYNRLITLWLQDNDIEMYSRDKEETFVVAEKFIRILKNKIGKHTTL